MIESFTYYLNKLLTAGITDDLSSHEKFRIKSLNLFCLVCTFLPFVYIGMLWNSEFYKLNYVFLFFQTLFFLSIVFNLLHKIIHSRLILVFTTSVSVVVVSWITGYNSGFHLYLYCTPLYVFLLFKLNEIKYIGISIAIYASSYILIFLQKAYFQPFYTFEPAFLSNTLYPINLVLNFILLLFLFYNYTTFYMIMEKDLLNKQRNLIEENIKRAESEQKIQKLFNDLTQSYKNLEQFSFVVSHNLRAPLTNIIGLSKLIDKENFDDDNKEILNGIESSAENLDVVLNDLNFILKLKTDKLEDKSNISFANFLQKNIDKLNTEYPQISINFELNFDKTIQINSIESLLEKIIYNILQNSIKFRNPKNQLKITIDIQKIENQFEISITDNGIGIDLEKYIDRLFTLYGKFNRQTEGKGMGLYLIKIYTELLGGKVEIESKIEKYTKIKLLV